MGLGHFYLFLKQRSLYASHAMKCALWIILCVLWVPRLLAVEPNQPVYVMTKENRLWTESLGTWSPRAIVMIAGAGGHGRTWNNLFCQQLVDAGYFIIRYDHRDTGLSSSTNHPFEVEDLAEDVVAILDAYSLPAAHVVGHSMGGMIGQFLAAKYPDRVLSLSVIGTAPVGATPLLDRPLSWSEVSILTQTLHFLTTHPISKSFEGSYTAYRKRIEYLHGGYPLDETIVYAYVWECYYRTVHPIVEFDIHVQNVQKMLTTLNQRRDIFEKIEAPVLVIHGGRDTLILPSRGGLPLYEALQDAELKIIPEMGHFFYHRELIQELSQSILLFVNKHSVHIPK